MTVVSRAVLKSYFETGDKPTEAQFIDLIDSILNLNDDSDILNRIPQISEATGQTGSFQQNFTANKFLLSILFIVNSGSAVIKVGTSNGASDIIWEQTIDSNQTFNVPKYFDSAFDLWFTVVSGTINFDVKTIYIENLS